MDKPENQTPPLASDEYLAVSGETSFRIRMDGHGTVSIDGRPEEDIEILEGDPAKGEFTFLFRNTVYRVTSEVDVDSDDPTSVSLRLNGRPWSGTVDDRRTTLAKRFGSGPGGSSGEVTIKAPMPGLVSRILVQQGDTVRRGDGLLILEAMKMENEVKAEYDGSIIRIDCKEGSPVEKNARLFVIHYEH